VARSTKSATWKLAPTLGVTKDALRGAAGCYVIHFDRPLILGINVRREVGHYIGTSVDIFRRLQKHATKPDAKLMAMVRAQGISWTVTRVFVDGPASNQATRYQEERRLKEISAGRLCDTCHPGTRRGCHHRRPGAEYPAARQAAVVGSWDVEAIERYADDLERYPDDESPF
jgi:predicted GIY-YIG superfamily endonuclease